MSKDDMSRRIAEIIAEPDPATFDQMVENLTHELVEHNPDGPDFYTVKTQLMDYIRRMIDILTEPES